MQNNGPSLSGLVTMEDRRRAEDRTRVQARRSRGGIRLLLLLIGPGILVMLGENDGPSMISYATTGASYGIGFFLPFILLTFGMAYVVQEMVLRLAIGSQRGQAQLIYERFGQFWGNLAMFDLVLGNVLTLVTEFIAISAGLSYFGVRPVVGVLLSVAVLLGVMATRRYSRWERITLCLALGNLIFIPVALMAHPSAAAVGSAIVTWSPLPGGFRRDTLLLMMSNIGATVTPWMLFFQQSAGVDKGLTRADLKHGRLDTAFGAILAAVAAVATVLATAPLYAHHVHAARLDQSQFAQALAPYTGHLASTLFAIGLVEAGLVAAITISVSSGYAFSEVRRSASSLNASLREAPIFYLVTIGGATIAAAVVLIPHAPLTAIEITVNVVATMLMPPALIFILFLVNDEAVMGKYRNSLIHNILAIGIAGFIAVMGAGFGLSVAFPYWGGLH